MGGHLLPRYGGGRRGHSVSARPSSGPNCVSSSPNSGSVSLAPSPGGGSSGRRPFERGVVATGMAGRDPGGLVCGFGKSRDVARGPSGTSRDFLEGFGTSRDFAGRSSASSALPFKYAPSSFLRSFRASCARCTHPRLQYARGFVPRLGGTGPPHHAHAFSPSPVVGVSVSMPRTVRGTRCGAADDASHHAQVPPCGPPGREAVPGPETRRGSAAGPLAAALRVCPHVRQRRPGARRTPAATRSAARAVRTNPRSNRSW